MDCVRIKEIYSLAIALTLGMAISAGSHGGDRVYPVRYLSDEGLERIQVEDSGGPHSLDSQAAD